MRSSGRTARRGEGKYRTVGMSEETPEFKARVKKTRRRNKLAKKAKQANRRK